LESKYVFTPKFMGIVAVLPVIHLQILRQPNLAWTVPLNRDVKRGSHVLRLKYDLMQRYYQQEVRLKLERSHDFAHGYIGGTRTKPHFSFEDPHVALLIV
jgi:hypothetical protein